ncbi:MAG: discoidin domain-containing protein [Coriobacteriia bacterium]
MGKRTTRGGIANLYVDEVLVRTIDFYGLTSQNSLVAHVRDLGPGEHVVRLEHTGTKSAISRGYEVWFQYLDVRSAAPSFEALPACTACHFTFEQHYGAERHTSSWSPLVACSGAECHSASGDLMTVHQEKDASFTCAGCHSVFAVAGQIEQGLTGCGDCHDGVTQLSGHRDIHGANPSLETTTHVPNYAYYTGSVGTPKTTDCAGCHTSNLVDEHLGLFYLGDWIIAPRFDSNGAALTCASCHSSADSIVVGAISAGLSSCESCHQVHGPIAAVHAATFETSAGVDCAQCHSSQLESEHNGAYTTTTSSGRVLSGCAVCHSYWEGERGALVESAISASGQTQCSACHGTQHPDLGSHAATTTASQECAVCHDGGGTTSIDVKAVHAGADLGACAVCHSNADRVGGIADLTAECSSCHAAEGATYHRSLPAAHTNTAMDASCTGAGCHVANTLPDEHERFLTDSGYATTCALCHDNADSTRIDWSTATASCNTCHTVHGDIATIHRAGATDDCFGCHKTDDALALHIVDETGETDCAACHNATTTLPRPLTCGGCHASEGTDYHSAMGASHTYLAMDASCTGAGCHEANTLPEEHQRFLDRYSEYSTACELCHENNDANRIDWGVASAACDSCHVVHGDIGVIHTAISSQECVDCHETGDAMSIHTTDSGETDCSLCHAAPAGRVDWSSATIECASCHGALSPVDPGHYPLDAHDAIGETGCNKCHLMDMKAEHAKPNVAVSCANCHEARVDAFTSVWDKTCGACHPIKHGDKRAKHASATTACGGPGCHDISDVAVIHGVDGGPGCSACHVSSSVVAATTDCTASGCHASVGTSHHESHNSAAVNPGGCGGCHSMYLDDEHAALGFTCDTCHKSTVSAVQTAIASGDVVCRSCHPGMHSAQDWEFNPNQAGGHRVSAEQPGMRSSFVVNGSTYSWSLPTASSFLKSGWTTNSVMGCDSCHGYTGATGPHGATMKVNIDPAYPNPYPVTAGSSTFTAQLSPNSSTGMSMRDGGSTPAGVICEKCHDLYNGSSWSNAVHRNHDDRGDEGGYCNYCHVDVPHGWGRPRLLGYTTDDPTYAAASGGLTGIAIRNYTPTSWDDNYCTVACHSHGSFSNKWPATSQTAPPVATTGVVTGTVKDSATNTGISGATVTVGAKTATTSSTGAYTITDVVADSYAISVTANTYNAWSGSVTVTAGATTTQNIALTATPVTPPAPTVSNLARTGTASASSIDGRSYAAYKAIDGSTYSYWRSNSNGTEWLRVDLGATKTISSVVVDWYSGDYARTFRIETSPDGSNWTSRYYTVYGDGGVDAVKLSSVSARYVRVYMTRANDDDYRIREFEVWGN